MLRIVSSVLFLGLISSLSFGQTTKLSSKGQLVSPGSGGTIKQSSFISINTNSLRKGMPFSVKYGRRVYQFETGATHQVPIPTSNVPSSLTLSIQGSQGTKNLDLVFQLDPRSSYVTGYHAQTIVDGKAERFYVQEEILSFKGRSIILYNSDQTYQLREIPLYFDLEHGILMSPNGDGKYDELALKGKAISKLEDFKLEILNTDGDVLFTSTDPTKTWDGKKTGSRALLPSATYQYKLQFNGQELTGQFLMEY